MDLRELVALLKENGVKSFKNKDCEIEFSEEYSVPSEASNGWVEVPTV